MRGIGVAIKPQQSRYGIEKGGQGTGKQGQKACYDSIVAVLSTPPAFALSQWGDLDTGQGSR